MKRNSDIILGAGSPVQAKARALVELLEWLDYECAPREKEVAFAALDSRIQAALDELWSPQTDFYAAPANNGHWTGEKSNSVWIPDDDFTPPNRSSYCNLFGLSWGEIKQKHAFTGLRCRRGRFCFEDIARYRVEMPDFADLVNSPNRGALHEAAFARLAAQLGVSVEQVKAIKECRADHSPMGHKNLVWHEDVDCCTMYLVPQEIHGNIKHFGAVAMCQLMRRNNLI